MFSAFYFYSHFELVVHSHFSRSRVRAPCCGSSYEYFPPIDPNVILVPDWFGSRQLFSHINSCALCTGCLFYFSLFSTLRSKLLELGINIRDFKIFMSHNLIICSMANTCNEGFFFLSSHSFLSSYPDGIFL